VSAETAMESDLTIAQDGVPVIGNPLHTLPD
jgi:hypothetical protein